MKKEVKVLLVGVGGYGCAYLRGVFFRHNEGIRLVGIIDPVFEKCRLYDQIVAEGFPCFHSYEEFEATGEKAELAFLATPLPLHKAQIAEYLGRGIHVLCEKPVVPTLQDLPELREIVADAEKRGLTFSVGFQWNFSPAILELKKRILAGDLGKAVRMKAAICWNRDDVYYARGWAAKLYDRNGNYILDSIVTNATCHHVQIMLFLLGSEMGKACEATDVKAALYRVNPIETYDTAFVNMKAESGADLYLYATHAGSFDFNPAFVMEFEKATVSFRTYGNDDHLYIHYYDGTDVDLGPTDGPLNLATKVEAACEGVRTGISPICGIDASESTIRVANSLLDYVKITDFPKEFIKREEERKRYIVPKLTLDLLSCYDTWTLPYERGFAWAVPETEYHISTDYDHFEGRLIPPFHKN